MALQLAALTQYCATIDDAVAAASVPGEPTEPQTLTGLSDMGQEELKRNLPGSVLKLDDGSYAFVPLTHAVVVTGGGETKITVKAAEDPSVSGTQ